MNSLSRRLLAVATATLLGAPLLATLPAQAADEVTLNLIGINDFHGRIDANTVKFAGTVEQVRKSGGADANSLLISAGDNVSASLFASAVQGDIPTIDVLNALHLDASAAGNHEFDKGADDLTGRLSDAADFPFLSANVFEADDSPLLDKYEIFTVDGVDVAVVGAVTEETPSLVSPGGIQGLTFTDPTEAINDTVDELEALADPPDVIVASIHEGAPDGTKTYQENVDTSPVFKEIMEGTDARVDAIFMGHTHQAYAYDAPIPGQPGKTRPVLQTGNYGSNVGNIKLTFDKDSDAVVSYTKSNIARTTTADADLVSAYPRVATVKPIVDDALEYAAEKGNEPIGEQTADITTAYLGGARDDRASESTLGNLVADSLLASVKETPAGADIGVTNSGGLRAELLYAGTGGTNQDGVITYAEANSVLPFVNNLSTTTLSGAAFKTVLEQQWQRDASGNVPSRAYLQLGLSKNVGYTFDPSRPEGDRITSITINGEPYDPAASYKIALPSFLTTGGDNFRAFTLGTSVDSGLIDYEAFIDYLRDSSPVSPDYARRTVQVDGIKDVYAAGGTVTFSLPKLNLTSLGSTANTSVSAKLLYGDDEVKSLGSKSVSAAGASGTFTFTLPAGVVGPMTIEASAFPTGTKARIPLVVKKAAAVTVTPSTGDVYGEDATVGVTVAGTGGTPTGTVTLKDGSTTLGSKPLTAGAASFTVDTVDLGTGPTDLTVTYSGDTGFAPGTGTGTLTVAKAPTTVEADDPDPVAIDESIDVPVTVESSTGTTPTGEVALSDGDEPLGSATLVDGEATVTVAASELAVGGRTLTVDYAGDDNHVASTADIDVDVTKGTTSLSATSGGAPYGTSAKVQVLGDEGADGLIYLGNGDDVVGVGFLRDGVANVSVDKTALTPGDHTLDVYYGGSATYDGAQSTVSVTITKAATTTRKVSVSPTTIVKNRTKPYVELTVKAAGFTVDSGTVTLRQSGRSFTGKVVDGKVRIRLGVFTSSGPAKTVTATYGGSALATSSTTRFTVKVLPK